MTPKPRLLAFAACLLASCAATTYTGHDFDEEFDRTTAPTHIAAAQTEIAEGDLEVALDRLIELHQTPSLDSADRAVAGELLNTTCVRLIGDLTAESKAGRLKRIFRLEVPPRLRVEAGISAARSYLDQGERVKSFRQVRSVEDAFPMHHLRMQAGDLLLAAGLDLAEDDTTWFLFFSPARDRAIEVLDFLVLNYPFHPGCDRAYQKLGQLYEVSGWDYRAIARYEDLVAYHPESPLAGDVEARIPMLRLLQMDRDDYDRHEVLRAREEAASWLGRYPGHRLTADVEALLDDAAGRLVRGDMEVARFYLKIDQAFGARLHAERALREAGLLGDEDLAAQADELLARAEDLEDAGGTSELTEDAGLESEAGHEAPIPGEVDAG